MKRISEMKRISVKYGKIGKGFREEEKDFCKEKNIIGFGFDNVSICRYLMRRAGIEPKLHKK